MLAEKVDLRSCTLEQLETLMVDLGEKKFRGKQIFQWIHQKYAESMEDMKNIAKDTKEKLAKVAYLEPFTIGKKLESAQDNTSKYLFVLPKKDIMESEDSEPSYVESVFMKYKHGNAVCVSTQVGCRMGCTFCASTLNGLERNLSAGEIVSQVYAIAKDTGERISHVVYMGSGEPLDNFDEVIKSIHLLNSEDGSNIGQRHITLSTCGIIDKIDALREMKLQITLAVSLHAPNDTVRRKTMAVAKKFGMDELLAMCKAYGDTTKRRVTFEYALISGLNDKEEHARELSIRLKGMLSHVNLIPVNEVKERGYEKSSGKTIEQFAKILQDNYIETTIRRELGSDINAACGQLRNSQIDPE